MISSQELGLSVLSSLMMFISVSATWSSSVHYPSCFPAERWFTFTTSRPCFVVQYNDHCLAYHIVWKSANNAIIRSLLDVAFELNATVHKITLSSLASISCTNGLLHFTFVRDPLAHFVSGYAEYKFRGAYPKAGYDIEYAHTLNQPAWYTVHPYDEFASESAYATNWSLFFRNFRELDYVGPAEAAKDLAVLTGSLSKKEPICLSLDIHHTFLQVFPGNLTYVGRLEKASHDWNRLIHQLPLPKPFSDHVYNLSSSSHITSFDILGARKSMWRTLSTNRTLRLALCVALAPSYSQYGYQIQRCMDCAQC